MIERRYKESALCRKGIEAGLRALARRLASLAALGCGQPAKYPTRG
jgi:hypothetical protein